jgi:hypothetical protein
MQRERQLQENHWVVRFSHTMGIYILNLAGRVDRCRRYPCVAHVVNIQQIGCNNCAKIDGIGCHKGGNRGK